MAIEPTSMPSIKKLSLNFNQNQMDDEKTTIQLRKKYWEDNVKNDTPRQTTPEVTMRQNSTSSEDEKIPEIKDIYDHIYGNVQSKLAFYENKPKRIDKKYFSTPKNTSPDDSKSSFEADLSIPSSPISSSSRNSFDHWGELDKNYTLPIEELTQEIAVEEKIPAPIKSVPILEIEFSSTPINSPVLDKKPNPDLLKSCQTECNKCDKADFINDRSEVLTEINASLKLELVNVKRELKGEIAKNNELNFEIANIESALETYHQEAKNQKSTLSSIYSAMKNYVSDNKTDDPETYTYKRIKIIADYMESLKNKLQHQDRIIRGNFVENPYYTDLITKHDAVLKQLDNMSKHNQELQDAVRNKAAEELEIIKELNRQKFIIEHKAKEMENYYRNEIVTKESLIKTTEDAYEKQLMDYQGALDKKDEEILKIQKAFTAKINNYKQELVIVYRKWKDQKMLNNEK